MLCSSGAGKWVGNAIQVLTDSTWNHVAMVVRGRMTFDEETDQAPHGDDISRATPTSSGSPSTETGRRTISTWRSQKIRGHVRHAALTGGARRT